MTRLMITLVALATASATPLQGQASWEQRQVGETEFEYRLENDDGAAMVLRCQVRGVVFLLEFSESLDDETTQASVRAIPGARQNIAVLQLADHQVQITGGAVIDTLRMLRDSNRLFIRTGGQSTTFDTSGSGHIVAGCLARQEALPE